MYNCDADQGFGSMQKHRIVIRNPAYAFNFSTIGIYPKTFDLDPKPCLCFLTFVLTPWAGSGGLSSCPWPCPAPPGPPLQSLSEIQRTFCTACAGIIFPKIFSILPHLPGKHWTVIGCVKNGQPVGVTVYSHFVENFEDLLQPYIGKRLIGVV